MSHRGTRENRWLDRLLRACDPILGRGPADSGLGAAFDSMIASIVSEPRHTPRRGWSFATRPRVTIAGVAALVVLTASAAIAATQLFVPTYSHHSPPKGMIVGGGPGELLYINGTDFRQIALRISADIPYPNGYGSWRDYVISSQRQLQPCVDPSATGGRASSEPRQGCNPKVPAGQLLGQFASTAFDAWVLDWRHDVMTGRPVAAARDARVISGALDWRAVRAWDPHPSTSVPGDMGTTHPSQFGWMIPFIQAVGARDLASVDGLILSTTYGGLFATGVPESVPPHLAGRPLLSYLDRHGI
jgi:hypothetical protein